VAVLLFCGSSSGAVADAEADRIAEVVRPTADFSKAEAYELNPGGAATSFAPLNSSAFSHPSANMPFDRQLDFKVGDGIFRKLWVSSPSSTLSSDGLGPLYNARSCQSCHLKDGRGQPPAAGEHAVSLFLRLSIPPQSEADRTALASHRADSIAEPTYGGQLQNFAIQGIPAEGQMEIDYEDVPVTFADGERVTLRKPRYRVARLNYGAMHPDAMLSPRVAPPMIGMGLLEAIRDEDLLALSDPDDRDGDGISGRPNYGWSAEKHAVVLTRFGWKAGQPSVAQQSAYAFAGDMGISSKLAPSGSGDCTEAQSACRAAPDGGDPAEGVELPGAMFDLVTFYGRNLAVPARRDVDDPTVLQGKRVFYEAGCIGCHRPKFVTRRDSAEPEQSFQLIWPYTDLLLHDMGEGLADGRPEGAASGTEWRTPPLWGIGLTETVSGHTRFLHDGRARSLMEAVLWHGGEAEGAKNKILRLSKQERDALIAFLRSL
jgi:CxxC motif-containing protein (DUF1111 family)